MTDAKEYLRFMPLVMQAPGGSVWVTYDAVADVLYINFQKPTVADDSELTDDDIIVRYEGDKIVGFTILHASQRAA